MHGGRWVDSWSIPCWRPSATAIRYDWPLTQTQLHLGSGIIFHILMFPAGKFTHLISDEEVGKLFRHLDKAKAESLEHAVIPLAIRRQFEFAGRRSESVLLEWDWVDLKH